MTVILNTGFVGGIIFFGMSVCAKAQDWLSSIFEWIFMNPALLLMKKMSVERDSSTDSFACLDLLQWHHKAIWTYLQSIFKISKIISGISGRFDLYAKLLTWNHKIPLKGYVQDKTTFTIEQLGKWNQDKTARGINATWLSSNKFQGKFQIIDKELREIRNTNEVVIKCLWISGVDIGKMFTLEQFPSLQDGEAVQAPTVIYFPPKLLILLAETVISAGAILALIKLVCESWKLIAPHLIEFWKWASSAMSSIL